MLNRFILITFLSIGITSAIQANMAVKIVQWLDPLKIATNGDAAKNIEVGFEYGYITGLYPAVGNALFWLTFKESKAPKRAKVSAVAGHVTGIATWILAGALLYKGIKAGASWTKEKLFSAEAA